MAQAKLVKAARGTGIDGVVASSDATNIGTDDLWVIVATGLSRDETIENLKDILYYMESTSHSWPFA